MKFKSFALALFIALTPITQIFAEHNQPSRKEIAKRIAWQAGKTAIGGIATIVSMGYVYNGFLRSGKEIFDDIKTFNKVKNLDDSQFEAQHRAGQLRYSAYFYDLNTKSKYQKNLKNIIKDDFIEATIDFVGVAPLLLSSAHLLHNGITGLIKEIKALRAQKNSNA